MATILAREAEHFRGGVASITQGLSFGSDPLRVSFIGRGAHHHVYRLDFPDILPKVLKVPYHSLIGINRDFQEVKLETSLINDHFPGFVPPTQVIPTDAGYRIVMDYVPGRPLSVDDIKDHKSSLGKEFQRLVSYNHIFFNDTGFFLDLIGLDGFEDILKHIFLRERQPVRISNLIVTGHKSQEQLVVVGQDLVPLSNTGSHLSRLKALAVYTLNQKLLTRIWNQARAFHPLF